LFLLITADIPVVHRQTHRGKYDESRVRVLPNACSKCRWTDNLL